MTLFAPFIPPKKILDAYNSFLVELGPKHNIALFRGQLSDREALKRILEIRNLYNFKTYVDISILLPICGQCKTNADENFGKQILPEIFPPNWQKSYEGIGIKKSILLLIEKELSENTWHGLFCFKCQGEILFNRNKKSKFYVHATSLTDYYGCQKSPGRSPTGWMKNLIYEEYGKQCTSCRRVLNADLLTIDHIVPWDSGGRTELQNLQPLCENCNSEKSNCISKIIIGYIPDELFPPAVDCQLDISSKLIALSLDQTSHPLIQFFHQITMPADK